MQGHIVPESFTHGTSEQRKYWFMKAIKPVTLIKVILLMHRDKDTTTIKIETILFFFYFLLQLSTPI
jgi:hypothetical protein